MKYSKQLINKIDEDTDIREVVPDLKGSGTSRYCKCPQCGKEGKQKGLIVTRKRGTKGQFVNIAKCFSCGHTIVGAINAYMEYNNCDFITAVEECARLSGVELRTEKEERQRYGKQIEHSFCDIQLNASGLSVEDVLVKVPVKGKPGEYNLESPFRKGGVDKYFNVIEADDEMLIYYFDLEGNLMYYTSKGDTGRKKPYVRVRWSNPAMHTDYSGKQIRYQTPKGAPTKFYIPEYIRDKYRAKEHIETLIIQEGEKKAEKACKHGIASIAIQGIYNIGSAESGLMKELQYIAKQCSVSNIVIVMDSDWDDLSKSLKSGDHVDQRPNQFAKAVVKFKQYVKTLHNIGINVDIYFGHINKNERGDKGFDDILVNTLKGREQELAEEILTVMRAHDGKGTFIDIHKISTLTDFQIMDFWKLNSKEAFFEKYEAKLKELKTFTFGRIEYVVEDGCFKEAARNAADTDFWDTELSESGKKSVIIDYIGIYEFLEANNYIRCQRPGFKDGDYIFAKIEDGVISQTSPASMRDFVYLYVLRNAKDYDVKQKFAAGLGNILSSDRLERIRLVKDDFYNAEPYEQKIFYKNGQVKVTAHGIEFGSNDSIIWEEKLIGRDFKRVPILAKAERTGEDYDIRYTEAGKECEFLAFIQNTSDFWKDRHESMTQEDYKNFRHHIVNKLTAIGYLLTDYKYETEQRAVVAMDAKIDEIGKSNGRSGKSLIGKALSMMISQIMLDGKSLKNDDDYMYSMVTHDTKNIFIDDVRVNFDFEKIYQALTGDLNVNPKMGARYIIKNKNAPKFYIATNHAINDTSSSGKDRRIAMAFSDYYNSTFTPMDDFGHALFSQWDEEQWNLFDNLMIECIWLYHKAMEEEWEKKGRGAVSPPMEMIEQRELRQQIGEAFLAWAEGYFSTTGQNINQRIRRKDMYDAYLEEDKTGGKYMTPHLFGKKIKAFCKYAGLHFNPCKPSEAGVAFSSWRTDFGKGSFIGDMDKSAGVEYFTVATNDFSETLPF